MNPLLQQFITDANDILERMGQSLLALEKRPDDEAVIDELFRAVHTLKGNSGLFDIPIFTRVVHAAEDLLDKVRDKALAIDNDLTDELLDSMDFIQRMVEMVEASGRIPEDFTDEADRRIERLKALLPEDLTGETEAEEEWTERVLPPENLAWLARLSDADRAAASEAAGRGALTALRYVPEPECFFKGEDPLLLLRNLPGRTGFVLELLEPYGGAEDTDIYRCNIGIHAVSSAPIAELRDYFRYVPEQVALYPLTAEALETGELPVFTAVNSPQTVPDAVGEAAPRPAAAWYFDPHREPLAAEIVATQRRLLDLPASADQWDGRLQAIGNTLAALFAAHGGPEAVEELKETIAACRREESFLPLAFLLETRLGSEEEQASPAEADVATATATTANGTAPSDPPDGARPADDGIGDGLRGAADSADRASRVLKVPQEKVDRLMDLIGEMVVAKNALPYLASKAEEVYGSRELAREIKAQFAVINRIAEDMQDGIMQVRMLPMSSVFQRFPRLVRDVARQLGKKVRLVLEGEDAEADKHIVESLGDPLIHILRNSLDHGLETPDVRVAAGKPEEGRILVRASQEGDRVLIEIEDDGKGIDPAVIKRKAFEKGLIDEARLESISDTEAIQLVFAPGFSTAETVSSLSGRGVGMDVVKTSLEKIGGQVRLTSERGRGTRIVLTLPLSVAVSNVLMVRMNGQRYGVPMDMVVETVRVPRSEIHVIKDRRVAVLRGRIVPLFGADELLSLPEPPIANGEGEYAVLVARVDGATVGLIVDGFAQTTDVILKPLEGPLAALAGFAGSALLGDGSVLLVLDLKELMHAA
ncbi:chemotaxis protein CheA [Gellertiella hungarica]|uniref:Chemotaxis protein CheA n=1 Tax=Gellertiella hungarica TaxID=1572859 RepID=A0A7W6J7B9_9HYPH|nr:chemotaxis protein CheA [Gellertiella hungarica]MBB4066072.1 two-component system chemotaxis sensor kinase CheA [Gellertiella hungarica]